MSSSRPLILAGIFAALVCDPAVPPKAGPVPPMQPFQITSPQADQQGLVFRLSEGTPEAPPVRPVASPPTTPLTAAESGALLDRLPPLGVGDDAQSFAFPARTLPVPRTGKTVAVTFPPEAAAGQGPPGAAPGPLQVLRHAPDGEVPLAPNLSVTFDQPMVTLTSHEELAKAPVPVKLAPQPPGEWRWIGTKTVVFEPADRFPMATDFSVEVPAGTGSATGGMLGSAERWRFSTPPPTLVSSHPASTPARHTPLMFASFDQRIDPAAVLATITVRAGSVSPRLRLATLADVNGDPAVRALAERSLTGRWLAFTTNAPLPAASKVSVVVGPGTPSVEGPRRTAARQEWGFSTFGPLQVERHDKIVSPSGSLSIHFSNPIDRRAFRQDMVRMTPEVPGLRVMVFGPQIVLRGAFRPRGHYSVTLSAALIDEFGQTLGRDLTLAIAVEPGPRILYAPGSPFVVVDPGAPPAYAVFTSGYTALDVLAHAVSPSDWEAFREALRASNRDEREPPLPGRRVFARTITIKGSPDDLVESRIDLAAALNDGHGQVVLRVRPAGGSVPSGSVRRPRGRDTETALIWVQATRLALEAFVDADHLLAYASRLDDGSPAAGVDLELLPSGATARTGPDGLAQLPLGESTASVLVARSRSDSAFLPEQPYPWGGGGWERRRRQAQLRWFVFDDRAIYRPGEEARFKGWVRRLTPGPGGDVAAADRMGDITYRVVDSRGNDFAKGTLAPNRWGAFTLAVKPPAGVNLGHATLELSAEAPDVEPYSTRHRHGFQIQEFRTPEYEVKVESDGGPHFVGGRAAVTVTASYYAGGALPGAGVDWQVRATPGAFVPPNRSDFVFGRWVPWWERRGEAADDEDRVQSLDAATDSSGRHTLRIDFDRVSPPRPMSVLAEATVQDVNRQAWSASTRLLVHPADRYVGVRLRKPFVQKGEPVALDLIVTDLDGRADAGRTIDVRVERLEWAQDGEDWVQRRVDRQDCRVTSASDPASCAFNTAEGGQHEITAAIRDDAGRANETVVRVWVAGSARPSARRLEAEEVTLITDRERYRPGDTAEVLVVAPFAPAEGVMTLQRDGLLRSERLSLMESTATIRVPIEEAWLPGVSLQVDLYGSQLRDTDSGTPNERLPRRPSRARGTIALDISNASRALTIEATARVKTIEPGGETTLDAIVRDAAGSPVRGAEVAVVVVDEAVLSLTGYQLPAPLAAFYTSRPAGVESHSLRDRVILASRQPDALIAGSGGGAGGKFLRADAMAEMAIPAAAPMEMRVGAVAKEAAPTAIHARSDFNPLAVFVASAETDAGGRVSVPVKVPDNLTRYRVMAVAADATNRFGSGESMITARLPLMARVSPPRFLNFGDRFDLPVVLQNQTDRALRVDVAVRASNITLTDGPGRRVEVPANDRVEVRFAAATRQAGRARVQVAAAAGPWADASDVSLPVWTPATTEAFATYGQIDEGAVVQPLTPPRGVVPEFGGLEVATSSTALQALTDAMLYLVAYPFECAEQLSSRVLAVAALRDVLTAFSAEGLPPAAEIEAAMTRDLARLATLQNADGGFGFWRRGDESWPFISVHVTHALARARARGYAVPAPMLERAKDYLQEIERRIPSRLYSEETKRTLVAYALAVRAQLGDRDVVRARRLVREATLPKLSFEAIGWLLGVLSGDAGSAAEVTGIRRLLANRVTETAGAAHFVVSYGESDYLLLHSDRRADAVLLDALITDQPKSDLILKLVAGLLAHRKAGRWSNTQENAFVLLALDRYFRTYEAVTPDFVARVWLGDRFAGEQAFRGRSTDRAHLGIPMAAVQGAGDLSRVTLAKEGAGRLYYRLGLRYAPESLRLTPLDRGFVVERRYEAVDAPGDVVREADGGWRIKAGARVRVRVTLVAPARRYHVALVDPLPAGLEALNPELKTTGTQPVGRDPGVTVLGAGGIGGPGREGAWWWWRRAWYEHDNLRDDRAEAFASLLWEGVHTYSYVARATTPGVFVVPPPRAEEMYAPETFGRGATDTVTVR